MSIFGGSAASPDHSLALVARFRAATARERSRLLLPKAEA